MVHDPTYPHDAQLVLIAYLFGLDREKVSPLIHAMLQSPWLTLHRVFGRTVIVSELVEITGSPSRTCHVRISYRRHEAPSTARS